MRGDALCARIWKDQQTLGRGLKPSELGLILKCPGLSVDLEVSKLVDYPIVVLLVLTQSPYTKAWSFDGQVEYYVTRDSVHSVVVEGTYVKPSV